MELNLQTAELALREASESNPGAWADHSRFVAEVDRNHQPKPVVDLIIKEAMQK